MQADNCPVQDIRARVPCRFWRGPVLEKARAALGMVLACRVGGIVQRGRIVEVEAYGGSDDPASHAFRRKTPRNTVMFGPGGVAYVYFIYGMHYCLNIVTGSQGEAAAILVRALEPLENITGRTDGPARLCAALGIDRQCNGLSLDSDTLWLETGDSPLPSHEIVQCPRIGINALSPAAQWPWRFLAKNSHHVSKPPCR
ncbi:MAG: DNA-3-methyladenine glycosylase [Chloroflexota bacterium]|nr:DNA-3-methyladenine glycosylase [Chloroflexota bacterium]MDE2840485.1 DNA-3-methyladenine glycosylase [Chloroflexota bacterium]MDE2930505.1 DNA-3-methyladenine glycosylase [Chloroflexota bacterium]